MKITIESTEHDPESPMLSARGQTVAVKQDSDDLTLPDLLQLLRQAVLAWGYAPESVEQYLPHE